MYCSPLLGTSWEDLSDSDIYIVSVLSEEEREALIQGFSLLEGNLLLPHHIVIPSSQSSCPSRGQDLSVQIQKGNNMIVDIYVGDTLSPSFALFSIANFLHIRVIMLNMAADRSRFSLIFTTNSWSMIFKLILVPLANCKITKL